MDKVIKVILLLCFTLATVAFSQMLPTVQEMPDYCTFVIEHDEVSQPTVTLDGTTQLEPEIIEDFSEYQFLLPRADNGRGNGSFQYPNPAIPIGDGHRYALVEYWNIDDEDQPNDDSRIFPSIVGENGELVFQISDFEKRGIFLLYKVLTIEEVEECNQFLENKIDLESLYQVTGLVYIPLGDYGIMDKFAMGIKAPDKTSTGNYTTHGTDNDDTSGNGSNVNDGPGGVNQDSGQSGGDGTGGNGNCTNPFGCDANP